MHGGILAGFRQAIRSFDQGTRSESIWKKSGFKAKVGRPPSFVPHQNPRGRYVLEHPSEWEKKEDSDSIFVLSSKMATFARVDIFPHRSEVGKAMREEIEKAGGTFEVRFRKSGTPDYLKADVTLSEIRFLMKIWAWQTGSEKIVLSTGQVIDPSRSRMFKQYEEKILQAIRRRFKVRT